jgi:LysR family transcriptional regulator, low CO2-responsive transcriptional regulator
MKNVTIRQLKVFHTVAKHLSFARAAEALHLTPPAVTMQIKELEANIGMPLFDRRHKQISLTTTGEYMVVYARRILATLKDAEDAAARLQRAESGILNIGMVTTSKYFMMQLLSMFRSRHPGVEIRLELGNRDQLVRLLEHNEVDIAVMGRPPRELRTRVEPFAAHPHVFFAASCHPLVSSTRPHTPTLNDLLEETLIVREAGSGTRAALERFLVENRCNIPFRMQLGSNEPIKQAVTANLGIGFVSLHTIGLELELDRVRVIDLPNTPVVRVWNIVHTQAKTFSPPAEAFRYFMLEEAERYLASRFGAFAPV